MRIPALLGIFSLLSAVFCTVAIAQEVDTVLKTGDKAPAFKATAIDGQEVTLKDFSDADVVVVVFTCNSCPVAVAYEERFIEFVEKYKDKNVQFVAINNHRGEDVEAMAKYAKEKGFNFAYAYDGSGESARAYGATVTPHMFVLDSELKVAYQGAFDDTYRSEPTENYVIDAVDALLSGESVPVSYKKAFGCGIKFGS